jgi:hypothetical protein
VEQPVGIEGVARAGVVEPEVDAGFGADADDAGHPSPRLAHGHAVLPRQALDVATRAHRRGVGIELVGLPLDLDLAGVGE